MRASIALFVLCACGGGGATIDAHGDFDGNCGHCRDARVADARVIDAAPPDAIPIDAMPPDAALPCDPGPFTAGVSTLSGCAEHATVDGPRGIARFANPVGIAHGPDGNTYVADFDDDRIREVASDGTVTTLVHQASFKRPFAVTFASDGTLYVSTDTDDNDVHDLQSGTIWKVNTTTGAATVVARDVGRARGMVVLGDGTIVFSDYLHETISTVNPTSGAVTLLAGAADQAGYVDDVGGAARFHEPYGLALMPDGRVMVADYANNRLRAVATDGTVSTIAGTGTAGAMNGDALTTAQLSSPEDVAIDTAGDVFIADTGNFLVRKLSGGQVSTVIGNGTGGWLDNDDPLQAEVFGLEGIDVAGDGHTVWMSDGDHGEVLPYERVRVATLP